MKHTLRIGGGAAALLLSLGSASGCGGVSVGPGEYRFYRVALSKPQGDSSCFWYSKTPASVKSDTTDTRNSETFKLYSTDGGAAYLDMGAAIPQPGASGVAGPKLPYDTLEGTLATDSASDASYTFAGSATDVDIYSELVPAFEVKTTNVTRVMVELSVTEDSIQGSITSIESGKCVTSGAAPDSICSVQGPEDAAETYEDASSCTQAMEFSGSALEVELLHDPT